LEAIVEESDDDDDGFRAVDSRKKKKNVRANENVIVSEVGPSKLVVNLAQL